MISSLNAIDSFDELQKAKEVMKRREAAAEKLRQSMAKKQEQVCSTGVFLLQINIYRIFLIIVMCRNHRRSGHELKQIPSQHCLRMHAHRLYLLLEGISSISQPP